MNDTVNLDAYSPREIAERIENVGVAKARLPLLSIVMLGMLAAGVLLRNVPGDAARGLSEKAASKIRYGCLAVIFLQSGLEQDPSVFK